MIENISNAPEIFEKCCEKIDATLKSYNDKIENLKSDEEVNSFFLTTSFIHSQVLAAMLAKNNDIIVDLYFKMIKDKIDKIRIKQKIERDKK